MRMFARKEKSERKIDTIEGVAYLNFAVVNASWAILGYKRALHCSSAENASRCSVIVEDKRGQRQGGVGSEEDETRLALVSRLAT